MAWSRVETSCRETPGKCLPSGLTTLASLTIDFLYAMEWVSSWIKSWTTSLYISM